MKPGNVLCPVCRHWDGHADDCPERNSNLPTLQREKEPPPPQRPLWRP